MVAADDVATLASSPPAGESASHPFTCNTCTIAYRNIDLQRGHMKSDWHRYNLKRRVASLPPITSETFNEKVLQARAVQTAEAEKALFERSCEACQKNYSSENAYQNHLTSSKHKLRLAALGRRGSRADDASSVMSSTFSLGDPHRRRQGGLRNAKLDHKQDENRPSPVKRPSNPQPSAQGHRSEDHPVSDEAGEGETESSTPVPKSEISWTLKSCIFCNYDSPTVPLNAHHMERFHNMFIPEKQYLVDLEGLLQHLLERVHEGHQCLYCFKTKNTAFAVQTHMRDKGHCKVPFDTEETQLDIGDFYDFRSTYSDDEESDEDEEEEVQKGGAKLGARREAKHKDEDGKEVGEGDGWETDSSASSLDSEDLTAMPAERHDHQYERLDKHPHHSNATSRAHRQADGWHSHAHKHNHAVFYDDYEMHLPNGKSVGHRSMARYYKQNLTNYPTPEERAERLALEEAASSDDTETEGNSDRRLAPTRNGRALARRDAAGMVGLSGEKKRAIRDSEERGRKSGELREKRNDYKYGVKNNNQKTYYYRYQMGG
ncbi:zinc finger protein Yan [Verticillium alfalfae VaMs.102]|uniref:Zinc finger protein Yan n=1 Tax=Verticillium alfalfae (strain VaMs.102 / ATCC MYA-4576 / FGSC 10136) TaxID=526221 RepID=C9SSN8_VERA1|nr:zinc finger protein Yan [Verticillium alfalfae VaMs.102]EEY21803.1 zinc finger protein Yan [Verticillium alfalfae VaMs.102]